MTNFVISKFLCLLFAHNNLAKSVVENYKNILAVKSMSSYFRVIFHCVSFLFSFFLEAEAAQPHRAK